MGRGAGVFMIPFRQRDTRRKFNFLLKAGLRIPKAVLL